jgi:hypothetical protein
LSSAYSSVKVEEAGGEALDTMIRQMRGAEALSSASTANLLIFAVDLDGDGAREEVRFEVSGNTLQKGSIAWDSRPATPADWIAGCDQLNLTYWKTNDNTKELIEVVPGSSAWTNGDYLKITRIDMQLHMFRKAGDNPDVQRTVTGSVDLRNTLQDLF